MSPPAEYIFDIYDKLNAYMRIVKKTTRDMFPKAVTLYIIDELEKYINTDLLLVIMDIPRDNYVRICCDYFNHLQFNWIVILI